MHRWSWPFRLPVRDENLVGVLGLFDRAFLFVAPLLVVIGRSGKAGVAAPGGCAGGEFELAALVGD